MNDQAFQDSILSTLLEAAAVSGHNYYNVASCSDKALRAKMLRRMLEAKLDVIAWIEARYKRVK